MTIKHSLSRLFIIGLLAAAPAAALAQQPASPEQAAKSGGRTYTGGRHHPEAEAAAVQTPPVGPVAKSINEKGIKKVEDKPAELAVTPPVDAGKGHSEKGVK